MKWLFLPLLMLGLLVGCSKEESPKGNPDAQAVAKVTQEYIAAQSAGDWTRMCALLDDQSRQALQGNSNSVQAADCAKALQAAPKNSQQALRESTKGVFVIRSATKGNTGEVLVRVPDGKKVIKLSKVDGVWRVSITS